MAFYKSRKINKLNRHLGKSLKAKQNHQKVLNQIKVRGKLVNLFNYQYVSNDGSYLSAIFQTTKQGLESVNVVNERFNLANS